MPSVGMLPPTPVPSKNRHRQREGKLGENAESIPKIEVMSSVTLKAFLRPNVSESKERKRL